MERASTSIIILFYSLALIHLHGLFLVLFNTGYELLDIGTAERVNEFGVFEEFECWNAPHIAGIVDLDLVSVHVNEDSGGRVLGNLLKVRRYEFTRSYENMT